MTRRDFAAPMTLTVQAGALLRTSRARAANPIPVTLWKSPTCTGSEGYAQYLDQNGFKVDMRPTNDLAEIGRKAGAPEKLEGCHTSFIGNYTVEGHIPVPLIRRLLDEKPAIIGITSAGKPSGSPGMDGKKAGPFTVYAISRDGSPPCVFGVG